ncbi:MAG: glycosyltransferase [Christensenellaceae bacterium]|jgi:glycosyltransferase involved in cell wall biosynthesis
MHVIFCSTMFTDIEENLRNTKTPMGVASHKLEYSLLKGFRENGVDVTIVNTPRIRYYPNYKKIVFKRTPFVSDGETVGINIGFVNLPFLNYLTQMMQISKEVKKIIKERGESAPLLFCYGPSLPKILAMLYVKLRVSGTILCQYLGDLHGKFGVTFANRVKGIKGKFIHHIETMQDKLSKRYDCFAFMTDDMARALEVQDKPYIVVEGIYSKTEEELPRINNNDAEEKSIFYAGLLESEYGITHLLRAFSLIDDPSFRLRIAGDGAAVAEVQACAKKDNRISYLGLITPAEVERIQSESTILINPRTSENEFVKLSFPSKNMECIASGKPYIAHKLACYPPEYLDYILSPKDETDEALAEKIVGVCEMPKEERDDIGRRGRHFILSRKNARVQCSKIIDLLKQYI